MPEGFGRYLGSETANLLKPMDPEIEYFKAFRRKNFQKVLLSENVHADAFANFYSFNSLRKFAKFFSVDFSVANTSNFLLRLLTAKLYSSTSILQYPKAETDITVPQSKNRHNSTPIVQYSKAETDIAVPQYHSISKPSWWFRDRTTTGFCFSRCSHIINEIKFFEIVRWLCSTLDAASHWKWRLMLSL